MNSELHNPDNLTEDQIGTADGWRLLDADENGHGVNPRKRCYEVGVFEAWRNGKWTQGSLNGLAVDITYRTKLTLAELRAARGIPEQSVSDTPSNEEWAMRRIEMLVSPVDRRVVIQIIREAIGVSVVPINAELAATQRELKESQESADSACDQLGRAIYDRDRFFADLEVNRSALSEIAKMLNIGNPFIAGFLDEARIEIAKLQASVIAAKEAQEMADFLTAERDAARAEVRVLEDKMPWKEDFDRVNEQLSVARSEHAELTLALQRQSKNAIDASVSEASLRRENAELLKSRDLLGSAIDKLRVSAAQEGQRDWSRIQEWIGMHQSAVARAEAAEAERDRLRERFSEEGRLSESAISFANMLEPKLKTALARAEAAEAAVTKLRSSLENIAAQKLSSELAPDDRSDADFEGGYDEAVTQARHAALFQTEPKPEDGKLTQ